MADFNIPDNQSAALPQPPNKLEYQINGGTTTLFNPSNNFTNQIPFHIPDVLQNIVGPLIKIPHPTLSQIFFDSVKIHNIKVSDIPQDKPIANVTSPLGTPIMDNLTFGINGPNTELSIPDGEKFYYSFNDILITVTQTKKIIKTEIAANNGTIKEYIGLGDYEIKIDGRLTGQYTNNSQNYGIRPAGEMNVLHQILIIPKTLEISCKYLNSLGIMDIVINNFNFPQLEGEYSTQYFSIDASSDIIPENKFIKFVAQ
jgi:hypothetical protein